MSGDRQPRSRGERRREYSQNFLSSPSAVERFLAAADLAADDFVVEIGAGDGALTVELGRRVSRVLAYEIDKGLARRLDSRVGALGNVEVRYVDAMGDRPPDEPFKVVSNAPFGSTARVVGWMLDARQLTTATVITQKEYTLKRTGGFGGKWSKVTVETWPRLEWRSRGVISKRDFRPVPSVDAGILQIEQRATPLLPRAQLAAYAGLVELGFQGLGGSLFRTLAPRYGKALVAGAFQRAGVAQDAIVAFVHPDAWLTIASELIPARPGAAQPSGGSGRRAAGPGPSRSSRPGSARSRRPRRG